MKHQISKSLIAIILISHSLLQIYGIFFAYSISKSVPFLIINAIVFFILAALAYTKFHNRVVQWIVFLATMLYGFGGFIGLGWLFALIIGILYIVGGEKKKVVANNTTATTPQSAPPQQPVVTQLTTETSTNSSTV